MSQLFSAQDIITLKRLSSHLSLRKSPAPLLIFYYKFPLDANCQFRVVTLHREKDTNT